MRRRYALARSHRPWRRRWIPAAPAHSGSRPENRGTWAVRSIPDCRRRWSARIHAAAHTPRNGPFRRRSKPDHHFAEVAGAFEMPVGGRSVVEIEFTVDDGFHAMSGDGGVHALELTARSHIDSAQGCLLCEQ